MKLLITGATGFIGRELIPVLESKGHSLTLALRDGGADDRVPDASGEIERRTVVVGDIDERTDWRDALQGVEAVVHLAAHAHVMEEGPDEEATFTRVNAWGTQRLAEQAINAGVSRFVLIARSAQSRHRAAPA